MLLVDMRNITSPPSKLGENELLINTAIDFAAGFCSFKDI